MTIGHNNFLLTSVVQICETLASGQGAQASYSFPKKLHFNSNHFKHLASNGYQK